MGRRGLLEKIIEEFLGRLNIGGGESTHHRATSHEWKLVALRRSQENMKNSIET